MAGRTSKKSKAATRARRAAAKPALLSGGNPQIAKATGDAPVRAYIAAMPGWKRGVGRRLDALIVRTVPGVHKAVKWNSPFYGIEVQGEKQAWFLSFHCFTNTSKWRSSAARRCILVRPANPSTSTCATSTSTRTARSTKRNSPPG